MAPDTATCSAALARFAGDARAGAAASVPAAAAASLAAGGAPAAATVSSSDAAAAAGSAAVVASAAPATGPAGGARLAGADLTAAADCATMAALAAASSSTTAGPDPSDEAGSVGCFVAPTVGAWLHVALPLVPALGAMPQSLVQVLPPPLMIGGSPREAAGRVCVSSGCRSCMHCSRRSSCLRSYSISRDLVAQRSAAALTVAGPASTVSDAALYTSAADSAAGSAVATAAASQAVSAACECWLSVTVGRPLLSGRDSLSQGAVLQQAPRCRLLRESEPRRGRPHLLSEQELRVKSQALPGLRGIDPGARGTRHSISNINPAGRLV